MVNYDENKLGGEVIAEKLKLAGISVKLGKLLDQPTWLGLGFPGPRRLLRHPRPACAWASPIRTSR